MLIDKAVRGLKLVNVGTLQVSSRAGNRLDYLRDIEQVYHSYTCSPLRPVELAEIIGEDASDTLFLPAGRVRLGSSPLHDVAAIAALTQKKKPREVFEIGTFEGLTTVVFIKNSGPSTRVHTLDLPHDRTDLVRTERSYEAHSIACSYDSGHLIKTFGVGPQVDTLFGDSAVFDFSQYRDRIDLFFVDGAHTEDYVACDSYHAFESIASDGWVLWHDCLVPQVLKVLKQIAALVDVQHISGTNLALVCGKPSPEVLQKLKDSTRFPTR